MRRTQEGRSDWQQPLQTQPPVVFSLSVKPRRRTVNGKKSKVLQRRPPRQLRRAAREDMALLHDLTGLHQRRMPFLSPSSFFAGRAGKLRAGFRNASGLFWMRAPAALPCGGDEKKRRSLQATFRPRSRGWADVRQCVPVSAGVRFFRFRRIKRVPLSL